MPCAPRATTVTAPLHTRHRIPLRYLRYPHTFPPFNPALTSLLQTQFLNPHTTTRTHHNRQSTSLHAPAQNPHHQHPIRQPHNPTQPIPPRPIQPSRPNTASNYR